MKKKIGAVLAVVTIVLGTIVVSAECIPCTNAGCPRAEYCIEQRTNGCKPYCEETGVQRRMGRRGHHGGHHYRNNEYCPYR